MNPDTTRPAANDSPETVTLRIRAPHGVPVTVKPADDYGPWWSAIMGAVAFNALVWMLALIISA
jgi:hypothetical protein